MSLRWLRVRLRRVGVSGTARSTLCCVTKHSLTCEQRILILQPRLKRRWVQFSHQRSYDGMSPLKLENQPLSSHPPLIFPFYCFNVMLNTYSSKSVFFFFFLILVLWGYLMLLFYLPLLYYSTLESLEQGKRWFKEVNGGRKKKKQCSNAG